LNYIRGDQSNEGTSGAQYFRDRGDNKGTVGILGDVVDAKPVAIAAPKERYEETANPGYGAFKSAMSTRTPIVYVASNDGMLHAFNAETTGTGSARTATANSGKELWAYIPGLVMRNTTDESGKPDGLPAYAYAKGGVPALNKPAFVHHYLLNATPVVNDVDFNRTYGIMSNGDWRSLMVAGLGKGGKGYYALDVTHGDKLDSGSAITTESDAATKFLWEFSGDTDMGYTYGNPVITRSATYGWVVFVSSGYNNSTGNGAIWVLNAKTGAVLKKFQIAPSCGASTSTYTCVVESGLSSSNPLNLGKMTSFVTSVATEEVRSIYAGDMQGNLWRLDVDQADKANWTIQKLAQFTSPSGTGPYGTTRQPITTEPTVNWDKGKDLRWVFVGTGEDLSGLDRDATKAQANQVQSFYAIADGQGATPLSLGTPITRNDLVSTPPSSVASVDISGKRGWYMDLAASVPTSGSTLGTLAERVVLKPTANFGVVLYATNTPTLDLCSPGYSSKLYARGYLYGKTGASYLTNASGAAVPYFSSAAGNAADPTLVQLADKSVVFQSCDLTGKCTTSPFMNAGSMSQSRVSWRELINN
jgi:type IV pilus assembly protein PilY1